MVQTRPVQIKIKRILLAILLTGVGHFAFASSECDQALNGTVEAKPSIMQRYEQIEELELADPRRRRVITELINEHLTPILFRFADAIRALPQSSLDSTLANSFEPIPLVPTKNIHPLFGELFHAGFTDTYELKLDSQHKGANLPMVKGFANEHSLETMSRLYRTVRAIQFDLLDPFSNDSVNANAYKSAFIMAANETFMGSTLRGQLREGLRTIMEACSLLAVSPVEGLSASEVLKLAALSQNGRPSLIVQFALMTNQGMIGPAGNDGVYIPNPLIFEDGVLKWSPKMKDYFAHQSSLKSKSTGELERGMGCPVARCTPGSSVNSLQVVIDALFERTGL